jgi:hypothetical protein
MKKIFSLLFSIAFLLIFASFFSQKSFAGTQCSVAGGTCVSSKACISANDLRSLGIYDCGTGNYCCTNFNGGSGSSLPATPTNLVANPYCNVNASLTTFSWSAASGATYYKISWGGQGTITLGNVTSYSINPTCTTGPGHCSLSYSANIPWYVQACNPSGCVTRTGPAYTSKDCTTISCTGSGGICAANVCPSGTAVNPVNADLYNRSCVNPHPEQVPLCCFASAPSCASHVGGYSCTNSSNCQSGTETAASDCGNGASTTVCCKPKAPTCSTGQTAIGTTCVPNCPTSGANPTAFCAYGTPTDPNAVAIPQNTCDFQAGGSSSMLCYGCKSGYTLTNGKCTATPNACTPSTGTCTGVDSCSTTGSKTVVTCPGGVYHGEQVACTLTPASTCNQPTAPVVSAPTCDVATPTSEKFTWTTNSANTTETLLYYCDKTKAAAHSPAVSCARDKAITNDGSQAGWYLLPNNTAANFPSPQTLSGLTAGHDYTAFVRAFNGNHTVTGTQHADSSDVNFTAGDCATTPPGLALTIGLDGIGTTGDSVNSDWTPKTNTAIVNGQTVTNQVAGSNQDPKHPTIPVIVTLIDSANSATTLNGNVTFQTSGTNKGKYTGTVPYGTTVKAGTYKVKVTVDTHLTKLVPGTITIANTTTTINVPSVNLVAGDIDESNTLNGTDYHILLSCMSDPDFTNTVGTSLCDTAGKNYKTKADLEDNGVIDKFDYNLFLREFSKVQTGD